MQQHLLWCEEGNGHRSRTPSPMCAAAAGKFWVGEIPGASATPAATVTTMCGWGGGERDGGWITKDGRMIGCSESQRVVRMDIPMVGWSDGRLVGRSTGRMIGWSHLRMVVQSDDRMVGWSDERTFRWSDSRKVERSDGRMVGRSDGHMSRWSRPTIRSDSRTVGWWDGCNFQKCHCVLAEVVLWFHDSVVPW